jgi:hypothetical protein
MEEREQDGRPDNRDHRADETDEFRKQHEG